MKKGNPSILEVEAYLWDGQTQLPGKLILTSSVLKFQPIGFPNSHLSLEISLEELEKPEIFLLYDIARKGLRIKNKNGQEDLFVVPDLDIFFKNLKKAIL